jgi:hypothetical protein
MYMHREYFSIIFSVKMCALYFIKYQVCLVLAFCLCGTLASFCRKINFYSLSPSNPRQLHQPTITLAVNSLLSLCLIRLLFRGFFQVISFQDLPTLFFFRFPLFISCLSSCPSPGVVLTKRRHDSRHDDSQYNDIRQNDPQSNAFLSFFMLGVAA